MWIFVLVLWRIVGKVLRRVGWGGLLVPVAAMGMALAGVHLWTVALVLIALAVVFRKPLLAAALLPLSMISAGLAGLVVAAMTPGGSVSWTVQSILVKPQRWVALPQAVAEMWVKGGTITYWAGKPPPLRHLLGAGRVITPAYKGDWQVPPGG